MAPAAFSDIAKAANDVCVVPSSAFLRKGMMAEENAGFQC
jgi:hypothetical protein